MLCRIDSLTTEIRILNETIGWIHAIRHEVCLAIYRWDCQSG